MSERTHAPRSGGRTAEQRGTTGTRGRYPAQPDARRRGSGLDAPTLGTAALKPAAGIAEPARTGGATAPRLRVAPPAPISAPRAPFVVVVIAIVVAGVFGILLINTKTNENTFKISKLQDQQTALDNQQQSLENQIAGYESTGNLDAAARRLGLVKADTPAYIRLPDGKIIGVPRPGSGQPAVTAQNPAGPGRGAPGKAAQNPASGSAAHNPAADTAAQSPASGTSAQSPAGQGTAASSAG